MFSSKKGLSQQRLGIPLHKPVVLRTQTRDAINLALIVPHLDHKRPLMPLLHPCCWNICGKCCDCKLLGNTAWEQAGPSLCEGVRGLKPRHTSGRMLSEGDKKALKSIQRAPRMRGLCWCEVWCYIFRQNPSHLSPQLRQKQNVK